VVRRIPASKDVDGLTPESVGELARGTPKFVPCTPYGVVELLDRAHIPIAGKHVVILGRSNLVGRPLASLLLLRGRRADATVTVVHSRSERVAETVRTGDIVVAAIGKARFVTADMVKPGAVVVDVGINRIEDPSRPSGSRLVGDVDTDAVREIASAITPVPGGVGPMTVAMLLANTVHAAEQHARTSGHDLAIR
jgi:methylenetetrahydrofolate dehydrogenase (NADP+)/methenyltetrahydrofolate cyclohydrolase